MSRELAEPPDLEELLGPRGRLSLGDPDHVPAGIYAAQALRAWGLWEDAQPRLARADNVRAALALVTRREAPAGIVYATDAAAFSDIAVLGLIPAHLHEPIVYPAAVIAGHAGEARAFMDFLAGEKAKSILRAHGFAVR